jgi:hypothetical protein
VEKYLMANAGVTDKGPGYELEFLISILQGMHKGPTPNHCPGAIAWEDGVTNARRVRAVDGYCVHIGYTSSIAEPGGAPMFIKKIIQDGFITDKDSRSAPVIMVSREQPPESTPLVYPIISYTGKTGPEILTTMTKYQARPDFPEEITQAMIDDMAKEGMAALLIPAQSEADMTFSNSAMYGMVVEDITMDADTMYVSRDSSGEPITFNQALVILKENGFYDDTVNQMVLLPYAELTADPVPVEVVFDAVADPLWDEVATPQNVMRLKIFANDGTIVYQPTSGLLTAYTAQTWPDLSIYTVMDNMMRAYLGEDLLTADRAQPNDVDFTPLDPATYKSLAPLKYVDLSGEQQRYQIPVNGSYVDLALIQKDIPKVVKYVYNAVLMPLISKVDPF